MVEHSLRLNLIFHSLADATRRDILKRVSQEELSISELAQSYKVSFAAIAKQIQVLAEAKLVQKRREGKQQLICAVPKTLELASEQLEKYEELWRTRFKALDDLLKD